MFNWFWGGGGRECTKKVIGVAMFITSAGFHSSKIGSSEVLSGLCNALNYEYLDNIQYMDIILLAPSTSDIAGHRFNLNFIYPLCIYLKKRFFYRTTVRI